MYSMDYFLEIDTHLQGIGIRSMHIPDAKKVASKVFDAQLRNIADGGHLFLEYFMLLGDARWTDEIAGAHKASSNYFAQQQAANLSCVCRLGAGSKRLYIMASS